MVLGRASSYNIAPVPHGNHCLPIRPTPDAEKERFFTRGHKSILKAYAHAKFQIARPVFLPTNNLRRLSIRNFSPKWVVVCYFSPDCARKILKKPIKSSWSNNHAYMDLFSLQAMNARLSAILWPVNHVNVCKQRARGYCNCSDSASSPTAESHYNYSQCAIRWLLLQLSIYYQYQITKTIYFYIGIDVFL